MSSYSSFMGGVKPPIGRQLLTNVIIYYCIEYPSSWSGFELTTLVIDTDCTGICKSNYHTIATKTIPLKSIQLSFTYYSQIYHILTLTDCFCSTSNLKMTLYRSLTSLVIIMSPPTFVGRHIVFVLSVCPCVRHTVCQRNSSETTEQNFMKLGR